MVFNRPPSDGVFTQARPARLDPSGPRPPWRPAAARSPEPVSIGDLVALPILMAADGTPLDLQDTAAGRSVILVFLPANDEAACRMVADARALIGRAKAAGGDLFVIAPRRSDAVTAGPLMVDPGGRFAYTLGLAEWDHGRGRAHFGRAAGLLFDGVGRVIAVDLGEVPDIRGLLDALPSSVRAVPKPDAGAW